jgi:hypothetical protein
MDAEKNVHCILWTLSSIRCSRAHFFTVFEGRRVKRAVILHGRREKRRQLFFGRSG